MPSETLAPVLKSVVVNAPRERAFRIFTEFFGGWWPSTHHIGKQPYETAILEGRPGGAGMSARPMAPNASGAGCWHGSLPRG